MVEQETLAVSPVRLRPRRETTRRIPYLFDLPRARRLIEVADELVVRAEVKHHHYLNFTGSIDRDAASTAWLRDRVAPHAVDPAEISLTEAVRRFQSAHGLLADAVIGPETLFALAANDPGPRLLRTLD